MPRSAIFLLLILAGTLCPQQKTAPSDFDQHLVRFNWHFNRFTRAYWGCPDTATDVKECGVKPGEYKASEFKKARKEAMKVFDLRDQQ